MTLLTRLVAALLNPDHQGEQGFSTAELLANAALGVAALVVLWGLFGTLGGDIITFIRGAIGI